MVAEDIESETERRHYDRIRKEFAQYLSDIQREYSANVAMLSQNIAELKMSVDELSRKLDSHSPTLPDAHK